MDKSNAAVVDDIIVNLQQKQKEESKKELRPILKILKMSDTEAALGFSKLQRTMFRGCAPGASLF